MLVPSLVLFAVAESAQAVNGNPWHQTTVHVAVNGAQDVDCEVIGRYGVDGKSAEWSQSECRGGVDSTPFQPQAGEDGSSAWVEFKGKRLGEPAPANYTEEATSDPANVIKFDPAHSSNYNKNSQTNIVIAGKNTGSSTIAQMNLSTKCWNPTTQAVAPSYSTYGTSNNGAGFAPGAYTASVGTTLSCNNASYPYLYSFATCQQVSGVEKCTYYKVVQVLGPGIPTEGQGAGDACSAKSTELTLGASTADGWSGVASTIPAGTAAVPTAVGGPCVVTTVCVTLKGHYPGADADTSCVNENYGSLVAPPESGGPSTSPPPPAAGVDAPPPAPTTEQGFWSSLLNVLRNVGSSIVGALGKVVSAITHVLDGLGTMLMGLFVPSPGFIASKVDSVKSAWSNTPPGVVVSEVASIPGKFAPPSASDCDGPALGPLNMPTYGAEQATKHLTLHPLSTCDPARDRLATLVRIVLQLGVCIGAFMAGIRILGSSFGLDLSFGRGGDES